MSALSTQLTLPSPLYVLLEGGQYLTITGALSRAQVDVDFYDGSTYSKIVDAAMLGNAHTQFLPHLKGAQTSASVDTGAQYPVPQVVLDGAETWAPINPDTAFKVGADDLIPGITKKTITLLQWFDNAVPASGKLVGECTLAEYRGWSGSPPANLG